MLASSFFAADCCKLVSMKGDKRLKLGAFIVLLGVAIGLWLQKTTSFAARSVEADNLSPAVSTTAAMSPQSKQTPSAIGPQRKFANLLLPFSIAHSSG
jgi:hypothetical protein